MIKKKETLIKFSKIIKGKRRQIPTKHNKPSILILQNVILHYRKPFFNKLAKYYDITVLHSGEQVLDVNTDKFEEIITAKIKIGTLIWHKEILKYANSSSYDAIILMCDLHWVNYLIALYFHSNKTKFIWWGSWLSDNFIVNKIKIVVAKKGDANIFYSKAARDSFESRGVNKTKLFVANNTFDVGNRIHSYESPIKDNILFVGSFDKRKQLDVLVSSFKKIIDNINKHIILVIIGSGEEENFIKSLVFDLNLDSRVVFPGGINNPEVLKLFYYKSIASVSFGQAGLSVLQSFGFGVPFVTKENAISGGEKHNIRHGVNGFFCDNSVESLSYYLLKLCNNLNFSRELGENAYKYYSNQCTIEKMAEGFIDAIEYTLNQK